jgi:mRNA interferase MazF
MKRGEIWTMAGGADYAGKPRPVVIIQDDAFAARDSITICLITSDSTDLPLFRIPVQPTPDNGLRAQPPNGGQAHHRAPQQAWAANRPAVS